MTHASIADCRFVWIEDEALYACRECGRRLAMERDVRVTTLETWPEPVA